ncbi:hypothetical protein [Pasteuria penetrans]|uniref:hypothetical protein n=1 Tax=Pasteuria penetrans TaxID=86005 RepID=UPI000FBC30D2|nr:hypothetical protein [Pasteuria penetrans]
MGKRISLITIVPLVWAMTVSETVVKAVSPSGVVSSSADLDDTNILDGGVIGAIESDVVERSDRGVMASWADRPQIRGKRDCNTCAIVGGAAGAVTGIIMYLILS